MRLRLISLAIVIAVGVLAALAWQRNTARAPASPEVSESAGQSEAEMPTHPPISTPATGPGIEWRTPSRWVTQLAQGMRLATYVIPAPRAGSEPAECAVYYFGPDQGGGVEANIERWIGEFEKPGTPKRHAREVDGMRVSEVEVTGAYTAHAIAAGEAPSVKPGWTLRGAIVEGPSGAVFFKLVGPGATVAAASQEFEELLTSVCKPS